MLPTEKFITDLSILEVQIRRGNDPQAALKKVFDLFFDYVQRFPTVSWTQYVIEGDTDDEGNVEMAEFKLGRIEFNTSRFGRTEYNDDDSKTYKMINHTTTLDYSTKAGLAALIEVLENVHEQLRKVFGDDARVFATRDGFFVETYE